MGDALTMGKGKIDVRSQFPELAKRGSAMLAQGGRVRREALKQGLAVLRTGRVGAERLPMVQQAVAQSRQATAKAVGTTKETIARRNITGPFAGRALAGVRTAGAARTAAIPTNVAQSVINQAVPLAQQTTQLGAGMLGQAGQGMFSGDVFNAQAFSQAMPLSQTGSRGIIGGICFHPDTPIDTPRGEIAISDLRPGMEVWSEDCEGERIATVIDMSAIRRVDTGHLMLEMHTAKGHPYLVSPSHPLPNGTPVYKSHKGRMLPLLTRYTYDIRVDSPTGIYFVEGFAYGSTLDKRFR